MKALSLTALALALSAAVSAPAMAQNDAGSTSRIEPYVGVMTGLHDFDNDQYNGSPPSGYRGYVVEGVAGVNYNVGKFFVGAEGSVAKGYSKDINWEYGAAGRFGVRAGKDSLFFAKVGYQWTQFDVTGIKKRAFDGTTYGFGTELSLADVGLSAERSPVRLRAQVDTRGDFHSFRPMVGLVAKF